MIGKIHVAGEVKDGIQRCTRCHTRLNNPPYTDGIWPEGPVYKTRGGTSVELPVWQKIGYRYCGRKEGR